MDIMTVTITITVVSIGVLALFLLLFRFNRASLVTGFCFDAFLLSAIAVWTLFANSGVLRENRFLELSGILIFLFFLFLTVFGVYILIVYLLINTRAILKRERRGLSHRLTLICAAGLIALIVLSVLFRNADMPGWLVSVWVGVLFVVAFYLFHIFVFLTTLALYNTSKPRIPQDYLIVLGSGLIDGEVPPLLAGRIDRALRFAKKQQEKTGTRPVLIMSGGRGTDEPRSEAAAMREYAKTQGYDTDFILPEDQSRNTLENVRFSKILMDARTVGQTYSCAFVSNGYHLLRAGIYAKKAGLNKARGLGAKTAGYYRPNAIIREYIAFLAMHKKRFVLFAAALFAAGTLLEFSLQIFSEKFVI
jgi:uncharacterized SAM-binding protein YcdF (DUF218 family)